MANGGVAKRQLFAYVGGLCFLLPLVSIWTANVSYFLQHSLNLSVGEVTTFTNLVAIPGFLGFVFGFLRDRWAPFGRKDQGILLLFAALTVAILLGGSFLPPSYLGLLVVSLLAAVFGQFIGATQQGLTSLIGRDQAMPGRLAVVWQVSLGITNALVSHLSGRVADNFSVAWALRLGALVALILFALSLWRPAAVYDDPGEHEPVATSPPWTDVKRLAKTWAIYPVLLLFLLWNFGPGFGPTMQFYMTKTLHGTMTDLSNFNAAFNICFVPTFLVHGFLCSRVRLRTLLWISTMIAAPSMLPLLLVHSAPSAILAGVEMGLLGGFVQAAIYDLLIRTCPPGLEGTGTLLAAAATTVAGQVGFAVGARLYEWNGFAPCVWAGTIAFVMMLPVLFLVPRRLTDTRDGEALAVGA
jgi:MFS family permease